MSKQECQLLPFQDTTTDKEKAIPFELNDCLALVDWSGRATLHNKHGSIPESAPPILCRLGIDQKDWLNHIRYFERQFPTAAGSIDKLQQLAERTSRRWIKGMADKPVDESVRFKQIPLKNR